MIFASVKPKWKKSKPIHVHNASNKAVITISDKTTLSFLTAKFFCLKCMEFSLLSGTIYISLSGLS